MAVLPTLIAIKTNLFLWLIKYYYILIIIYLLYGLFQDLKSHAVTLFEVGKLPDESLDSLLMELDKVC